METEGFDTLSKAGESGGHLRGFALRCAAGTVSFAGQDAMAEIWDGLKKIYIKKHNKKNTKAPYPPVIHAKQKRCINYSG